MSGPNYCIVSSSYVKDNSDLDIVLLLRDKEGKRTKRFFPFLPYFFVREEQFKILKLYLDKIDDNCILSTSFGFRGIDGSKLEKIVVNDPNTISQMNSSVREDNNPVLLYESNLFFHYRFLIDNGFITGITEDNNPVEVESRHKRIFIDIEVLSEKEPRNFIYPIIIIGIYDPLLKEYHSIFTGKSFQINPEIFKTEPRRTILHPCSNEEELISTFAEVWNKLEPDVVVSFSPFDMEYLVHRMSLLGISPSFLSPIFKITWTRKLHVHCLHILDYAELYRKVFGEPVWNTLDFISKKELGYGKLEISSIPKEWKNDYRKVVEYNLRDVELLKDLEDEIGIIDNYLMLIWSVTGLDLMDCLIPNRVGDILHLREIKGEYIFPNESQATGERYYGALVLCENPGLHQNVAIFDWTELYPTLMEDFHMSFDTFDPYGDIKLRNGIGFTSSKIGCTVALMKPFRKWRQEIKERIKISSGKERARLKLLSSAIKAIINAEYGLYGQKIKNFVSRLYDPRIAGAITFVGREILLQAKKIIQDMDYTLIYADTDSLFILLKTENLEEEALKIKTIIETSIKDYLFKRYHVQSSLRLDLGNIFKKLLILTKKKYQGVTLSGENIVVGLNIIQKNTAKITLEEEQKVGKMRLDGEKISVIKKYIDKLFDNVKRGNVPIEEIIVKGRCKERQYKVANRNWKAIEYAHKRNIDVEYGNRFYWLYIYPKENITLRFTNGKSKTYPANVIAFNDPKELPANIFIDYKKMANYVILKALKRYIEGDENSINQKLLSDYR